MIMNKFNIYIAITVIFFIMVCCSNSTIISKDNILAIKVYKASSKVNAENYPVYKEITDKQALNKLVSVLNRGKKNRYILLVPDYYVEILYKDTIVEMFINDKYFSTTTPYDTSENLSRMIEDF